MKNEAWETMSSAKRQIGARVIEGRKQQRQQDGG
jgi:hypothetical protein